MAKTIVGLFDDASDAQAVVRELNELGIDRDQISIMANRSGDALTRDTAPEVTTTGEDAMAGAGIGAVAGGIGGLIVGLVALPIPGLGPVIAAGPIAAALTGAGIGAVTGGVIGALTHVGVPEEHAQHYAEGVRRGGTLVTVSAPDVLAQRVSDVMTRYHAVNVSDRATKWRESGWKGFDASAPALTAEDIRRERALYSNRDLDRGQVAFPVVEEKLTVGKREVERGGVRVSSRVVEQPFEQEVSLRDERGRRGLARGPRHRHRHDARRAGPDLRALLHHQGARQRRRVGYGAGPRGPEPRPHRRHQRPGGGHDGAGHPAEGLTRRRRPLIPYALDQKCFAPRATRSLVSSRSKRVLCCPASPRARHASTRARTSSRSSGWWCATQAIASPKRRRSSLARGATTADSKNARSSGIPSASR